MKAKKKFLAFYVIINLNNEFIKLHKKIEGVIYGRIIRNIS
jgi:hypothetical protein